MFESLNTQFEKTELPFSTENFKFVKLKDLAGKSKKIFGFFKTTGKYGEQYSLISDDCFINLPSWFGKKFENFSNNEKSALWNNGEYSITNINELTTDSGKTFVFDFVKTADIPEIPFN